MVLSRAGESEGAAGAGNVGALIAAQGAVDGTSRHRHGDNQDCPHDNIFYDFARGHDLAC